MRQTTWDVDPPNHDGPAYLTLRPYIKKPSPGGLDKDGNRIYKSDSGYITAHNEWIDAEIRRYIDENLYDVNGLCIQVEMTGPMTNQDPRHPTPDVILGDAMRYAGIEINCGGGGSGDTNRIVLMIGHKPRVIGSQESFKYKVIRWIETMGSGSN